MDKFSWLTQRVAAHETCVSSPAGTHLVGKKRSKKETNWHLYNICQNSCFNDAQSDVAHSL
uniref:Uncharacterized protein n=1 Tax=Arundo donax TaxID=35708 RepID=A0A0A9E206_ARUDO